MKPQLVIFQPPYIYVPPIIQTRIKRVFSIPIQLTQDIKHKQIAQKLESLEMNLKNLVEQEKSHQKAESLCEIRKQEVNTLMGIQNIILNPSQKEIPKLKELLKQLSHQFKLEGNDQDPVYMELIQKGEKFISDKYLEGKIVKKVSGLSNSVRLTEKRAESSDNTHRESVTIQNIKTPLKRPQSMALNNNTTKRKNLKHSFSTSDDLRLSFYRALNQQCKKLEDKLQSTIDNTMRQQTKNESPNIENSFAQFQQSILNGNNENSVASSDMPCIDFFRREQKNKSTYLNKTFAERTQIDIQVRQSRLDSYQTFVKSQKIKNDKYQKFKYYQSKQGSFYRVDMTLKKKTFQRQKQENKTSNSPTQKRKLAAEITINLKPRHHRQKTDKISKSAQFDDKNSDRYIQIGKIEKILQEKLKKRAECDPKIIEMKNKIAKLLFPQDQTQRLSLFSDQ